MIGYVPNAVLGDAVIENVFYKDWGCAGIVVIIAIPALSAVLFVLRRDDSEARQSLYKIKEQIATMFMHTILREARGLISLVEEHLPEALTRVRSKEPLPNRFDKFCAHLRELSDDELSSRSKKYGDIVEQTLADILSDEISRLVDAADPRKQSISSKIHNPTGLRFSLGGETILRLDFLARKTVGVERRSRRYRALRKIATVAFCSAALGGFLFLVPVFWVQGRWGYVWANIALAILIVFGSLGLLSLLIFGLCESRLKTDGRACEDDPGFEKAFELWKGR